MTKQIEDADIIIITAGAGFGVDSGLPDFRGNEGMWKAYPALEKKGISFESIANPKQFKQHPELAWAFYGHRFDAYKKTTPNLGFTALKALVEKKENYFVVTSNVDGQFQKAGFDTDKIYEVHGRINKLQCTECDNAPWEAGDLHFGVNPKTLKLKNDTPKCKCGAVARPNIMMFNDHQFNTVETKEQENKFNTFMHKYANTDKKIVIIEVGAGSTIPTIREIGENIQEKVENSTLIRINPREAYGPKGTISIAKGAVEALKEILPEDVRKIFFID